MDYLQECFLAFVRERFEHYRIGQSFYKNGAQPGDQDCQNPHLKTEADLQIKFGGFLELWLQDYDKSLVVHAELPIYANPRARADLTIHRVYSNTNWASRQQILESLESVIEIKYANVRTPLYDFEHGGIEKDIGLLSSLPSGVGRYLVLVDEAESIHRAQVDKFIEDAKANAVTILSNNSDLMVSS